MEKMVLREDINGLSAYIDFFSLSNKISIENVSLSFPSSKF